MPIFLEQAIDRRECPPPAPPLECLKHDCFFVRLSRLHTGRFAHVVHSLTQLTLSRSYRKPSNLSAARPTVVSDRRDLFTGNIASWYFRRLVGRIRCGYGRYAGRG